jgi:ADP-ribose pyrophosphatase YjhB (NUDIX family)
VDYRETLADALEREVREETGLLVKTGRPLFVSDTVDPRGPRHLVNVMFAAEVIGGAVTAVPEDPRVESVDLVEPDVLGELDLRPPLAEQVVAALREGDRFQAVYLGPLFSAEKQG